MNFRLSCIQTVSQKDAFVVVEFLLLQDKKMITAADRTRIDFEGIVVFYTNKNKLNDEKSLRYVI
jgi:hypothetical protein